MPPTQRPRALEYQLFRGTDAIREGLLTIDQLRSRAWRRMRYNVYADSRLDPDHRMACRAAVLGLTQPLVIAGRSAACLHGVSFAATAADPVEVILPIDSGVSRRGGLIVHRGAVGADDCAPGDELPRTAPERTAWDLGRWLEPIEAVPLIDDLLTRSLVTSDSLQAFATRREHQRGGARAARAIGLATPGAQSPPESRLRVRLVLAGLPQPDVQFAVMLPNGMTVHPDLAWPAYRVACEYDGIWHGDPEQLHRDRRRLNMLVSAGWIVLHATSRRVRFEFDDLALEIRRTLAGRGWRPGVSTD